MTRLEEVVHFAAARTVAGDGLARATALAEGVLAKLHPLRTDASVIPLRQGRLLVVDDHESNRDLIGHQLARQGYVVSTAADGRAALDMLANHEFDLVLLDILMPGVDGVEVLRRLKADAATREIPVIMISALDEVDSIIRCIEMGAADFVTKPFDAVLLAARIGTILELRQLRERERTHADALRREREWVERLLSHTFPAPIAEKIRRGEPAIVEPAEDATVLVAGIIGSAGLTRGGPSLLAERLSALYARFDELARERGIETVDTMGSCYVAAAGIPTTRADHAHIVAELALALHDEARRLGGATHEQVRLRIGIHTGAVAAGVFARDRLAFDVWGDGVETAQQLALHAGAGTTQVSPATHARLRDAFPFVSRGVCEIPGKGQMQTYLLQGPRAHASNR